MSKSEFSKPFNVEHARAGASYGYESGESAEIIKWDRGDRFPLVVLRGSYQNVELLNLEGDDGGENCNRLVMLPLGMIDGKPVFVGDIIKSPDFKPTPAEPCMRFGDGSTWQWPAPSKVYPVTQMPADEVMAVFNNCRYSADGAAWLEIANAALRHAIDAGQVVTAEGANEQNKAALQAGMDSAYRMSRGAREQRDMAIAKEVRGACMHMDAMDIDLVDIIAGVTS